MEHGPMVRRLCRTLLDSADADDAWAETFLAALRAYPRLPPGSNVRGWLVTIAHRKAIDQIRAASRRPQSGADVGEIPSSHADSARARRRLVRRLESVASQAAPRGRLPLCGRAAVRRGRRLAGDQRGRRATQCGGRHREPAKDVREGKERKRNMTSGVDRHRPAGGARSGDGDRRGSRRDRCAAPRSPGRAAERDRLLDVSYRTVDSPFGRLLLAATPAGPRAGRVRS